MARQMDGKIDTQTGDQYQNNYNTLLATGFSSPRKTFLRRNKLIHRSIYSINENHKT